MVDWVENCPLCKEGEKRLKVGCRSDSTHFENPGLAWHSICLDFIGPKGELHEKDRFGIVVIDVFSKWLVVEFTHDITTESTIKFLGELFRDEGIPSVLITDNGTQLVSREMQTFLKNCGVAHHRTTLYNPQVNGLCEKANKAVKGIIQMASANGSVVRKMVSEMLSAYRTPPLVDGEKSPCELMRGRAPGSKLVPTWMKQLVTLRGVQSEPKKIVDSPCRFNAGDLVKIKSGRVGRGLSKFKGPFTVKKFLITVLS